MQSQSGLAGDHTPPKRSNNSTSAPTQNPTTANQLKRMRIVSAVVAHNAAPRGEDHTETTRVADMLEQKLNDHEAPTTKESLLVLAKTVRQTLLEIAEIKEQNHERRHRELMQLLEKHLQSDAQHKTVQEVAEEAKSAVESPANTRQSQASQTSSSDEQVLVELSSPEQEVVVPTSYDTPSPASSVVQVDDAHIIVETIDEELLVEMPTLSEEESTPLPSPMPRVISQPKIIIPPPPLPLVMKVKPTPPNEFTLMREQMLEMQRRKMADRERKKQLVQQKLMDKKPR